MNEQFETSFQYFFCLMQEVIGDCYTKNYSNLPIPELKFSRGRRYFKIVNNHSVVAFVDTTNGDVLKPASWAAPAKHARGNIFNDDNGSSAVTAQGNIRYL